MINLKNTLNQPYTWKNLAILFLSAFIIRALIFGLFIQHEQRYWQADSTDYHACAFSITSGNGMSNGHTPIFWRTPGYPLYLACFYNLFGYHQNFAENQFVHKISIWIQIVLTSFIPLLLFFLALSLTGIISIAWISAWIAVFHLGFILASCYILSDALALIFFILFLLFFYKSFYVYKEPITNVYTSWDLTINALIAALFLALYTWMRPNGQFVSLIVIILLLFSADSWKQKFVKIWLFFLFFMLLIGGWCVRNYNLTGHWFYCPMSGPILQSFTLPKVMERITGYPLKLCHAYHMHNVHKAFLQEQQSIKYTNPDLHVSRELVCAQLSWKEILQHPFYCAYEWIKEVIKTTFDLYSSQIVYIIQKQHKWDPMQEFLTEKIWLCLAGQPMSFSLRILMWLEFIFSLLLWIGIFAGISTFIFYPLIKGFAVSPIIKENFFLWLKLGFMIVSLLAMTGGFGYARLRLPIDPLLIILSLTFWWWIMERK